MGFQTRVNAQPAPAVAGDFAGTNPRMSVTAPPGGYQAAPDYPATFGGALTEALLVGRFAWFNYATGLAANYFQPNSVLGFVHREDQTVITKFLAESRLGIQQGFPVTGCVQADVWADFAPGPDAAGLVVYADPVTGAASADVAGQGVTIAITASVANTGVMTVTVTAGALAKGQAIQDAALDLPVGTFIVSQLTGSAGSTGTYQLNQGVTLGSRSFTAYGKQATRWKLAQPVAGPAAFTGAIDVNGLLTVSAVGSGTLASGQLIAGTGVPSFAQILSQKSGTAGSTGVYLTNVYAVVASESMTAGQGTLGKISTWQA